MTFAAGVCETCSTVRWRAVKESYCWWATIQVACAVWGCGSFQEKLGKRVWVEWINVEGIGSLQVEGCMNDELKWDWLRLVEIWVKLAWVPAVLLFLLPFKAAFLYFCQHFKKPRSGRWWWNSDPCAAYRTLPYWIFLLEFFEVNKIYNCFCVFFGLRRRSNKRQPLTSRHTAPGTQNESHAWSASHMKHRFQCAQQLKSPSNFTKYCACQAKWISWVIRATYEPSFPMRGASKVTLQTHQVLCLPRNSEFNISARNPWIASPIEKTVRRHSERRKN